MPTETVKSFIMDPDEISQYGNYGSKNKLFLTLGTKTSFIAEFLEWKEKAKTTRNL